MLSNDSSKRQRVLSGMRPTGDLHLGHLCGALDNWLHLQKTHECFYFVADWHALTTDYQSPSTLTDTTREMVITWLSVGIDPQQVTIFRQSQTPEHAELFVLLSMFCPLQWLTSLPTYKEQQENLQQDLDTHGFLSYPLLQSADIMAYRADFVPVGEDQLPHIEFTREVARRFNHFYGNVGEGFLNQIENILNSIPIENAYQTLMDKRRLWQESGNLTARQEIKKLVGQIKDQTQRDDMINYLLYDVREILRAPEVMLTKAPRLPGTDGRKMSKSYNNAVSLFDKADVVNQKLARMKTDPARQRRHDKGNPDVCPVWQLHAVFSDEETKTWTNEGCRSAAIGCIDCKKRLAEHVNDKLTPIHNRRKKYEKPGVAEEILHTGTQHARQVAGQTLATVRQVMGL